MLHECQTEQQFYTPQGIGADSMGASGLINLIDACLELWTVGRDGEAERRMGKLSAGWGS